VIDVDQDPLGKPGYRVSKKKDKEIWVRQMEDGSMVVGLFNRGENESKITVRWSDLNCRDRYCKVRDLWRQKSIGVFRNKFTSSVGRHGVVLIRLWKQPNWKTPAGDIKVFNMFNEEESQ
jgi:alpha-galactosidase